MNRARNMSNKTEASIQINPVVKIAVISLLILVVCVATFSLVTQQRAKTQEIICNNDLERLSFALKLYAADHDGKLPQSLAAAAKEIAMPVKLHFLAGTENSPLSSIFLAHQSHEDSGNVNGIVFYVVDGSGYHVAGDVTSQKEDDTKGLFIDAAGTPSLLICPGDSTHSAAKSWEELTESNITFEYVAQDAEWESEGESNRVVCVCQIHSLALLADGTVQDYTKHPEWLQKIDGHLYYKRR